MRELHALLELVLFAVKTNNTRTLPGAKHECEWRDFERQVFGKNEQLLLTLKELVEDQC